jgi:DNA-binding response OmpR family regulator
MERPSPSTDAVLGIHEGRVLVAGDDDASRALTTEVLRRAGYEAVAVTDGMQALEILLLAGRAADADVVTGLDSGANDYIAKPVAPSRTPPTSSRVSGFSMP